MILVCYNICVKRWMMVMSYVDTVQKVLHYIDDNLGNELSLDELADIANFSIHHFCRVFVWHIGYSVMEYVRIRRLEYAVSEFATDRKLIDIAMDYGFETYSGFAKAFKRYYYGVAPEKYRIYIQPTKPQTPNLTHMHNYSIGGIIMKPRFITHDTIQLAGYELKTSHGGKNEEVPAFWKACSSDGRMKNLHEANFVKNHSEYGISYSLNPETSDFSYIIGVEVETGQDVPEEFYTCTLPSATYAVFSTPPANRTDFSKNIQGAWQYIMNDWFPTSGYEYAPNCNDFEYYNTEKMGEDGNVCDIYIPVMKIM